MWTRQMLKMGLAMMFLILIWVPQYVLSHQTDLEQATVRPQSMDFI